jgi:NAD(P)-dependent dehydrogenase (short-subunit alcohol dehydrogenase family)
MKKVILITGVSSGFGKHTAEQLAARGHIVYGTVRRDCEVSSQVNVLRMDLTDISSIRSVIETIVKKEGRIDELINNAGMHTGGPAETLPPEYIRLQMDTNFIGTVMLTREVIPVMRKQGGGTIINFGSIGGLMGLPFQAYYSAAKFATEGFSEALRLEVRQFNIRIVLINPGDFNTNNTANRRKYLAETTQGDPYHEQFDRTLGIIENCETNGLSPEILARKMVRIVECRNPRQRYVIASFDQKLSVLLKKIIPGKWFMMILASYYKIS